MTLRAKVDGSAQVCAPIAHSFISGGSFLLLSDLLSTPPRRDFSTASLCCTKNGENCAYFAKKSPPKVAFILDAEAKA